MGHIGNVQETSSDTGMHNRAISRPQEQWMCLGQQRHTHITLCNNLPISVPFQCSCVGYVIYNVPVYSTSLALDSLSLADC